MTIIVNNGPAQYVDIDKESGQRIARSIAGAAARMERELCVPHRVAPFVSCYWHGPLSEPTISFIVRECQARAVPIKDVLALIPTMASYP